MRQRWRAGAAVPREVGVDHHLDELPEPDVGRPPESLPRLARVGDQQIDLRRAHEALVLDDVLSFQSSPTRANATSHSSRTECVSPVPTT